MKLPRIIEITWIDATVDTDGYSLKQIKENKPHLCERIIVGYLVYEDKDYIVLCKDIIITHGVNPVDENFTTVSGIPKGMIKKKRYLT